MWLLCWTVPCSPEWSSCAASSKKGLIITPRLPQTSLMRPVKAARRASFSGP